MFSIKNTEIGVSLYAPQILFRGNAPTSGGQGLRGAISPESGNGEQVFG